MSNPFKDAADEAFRKKEYKKSTNLYTVCIEEKEQKGVKDDLNVLYANRSASYLALNQFDEALKGCNKITISLIFIFRC